MKRSFTTRMTAVSLLALTAPALAVADPTFEYYGQLNFGLFNVDDGTDSETFLADNDNSNTRIGAIYSNSLSNGSTLKFHFETALGFEGSSAATIDNNDSDLDLNRTELRKAEIIYQTPSMGTFFIGQGSMSTDGIAEADLSGTTVVSYSSVSDLAASFEFRPEGGALSGTSIGDGFNSLDGARRMRLRYDTPSFNGFVGSISYGEERLNVPDKRDFADLSLKYIQDYGDLKVDGRVGYQWINDDTGTDEEVLAGSVAVFHKPTGVNFALASGSADEADAGYIWAKVGYQQDWFQAGSTSISFDIFDGSDFDTDGSDSKSYAISAVQKVDALDLEVYASYRTYEYDATGTDFEDVDLLVVGARWKF